MRSQPQEMTGWVVPRVSPLDDWLLTSANHRTSTSSPITSRIEVVEGE